jgi:pimeloyl-ACP methyl ester carboxylesterase
VAGVRTAIAGMCLVLLAACTGGSDAEGGSPGAATGSSAAPSATASGVPGGSAPSGRPVDHPTVWLCRPGLDSNPCDTDLDATVVRSPSDRTEEGFTPAADPKVDCFYVYPTVSTVKTVNAPLRATAAERRTVRAQAARFAEVCRVFAPVYRQITQAGLTSGMESLGAASTLAYADVRSAFDDYLNTDNQGRPFVLIGHSQGAWHATHLISDLVDGDPLLRGRMVSALLLGGTITTKPGQPAGGTFVNVPACRSATQTGCVVGYSTYDGTPPAGGVFGRSTPTRQALCVNPAQLLGRTHLTPYLPTAQIMGDAVGIPSSSLGALGVDTPFATFPDRVTARCRSTADFSWLDVSFDGSGFGQDLDLGSVRGTAWGLHTVDVSLALGDLVDLVGAQSEARLGSS